MRLYEEDERALAALRERYRAFTVDEYQDVNLLQQSLLELWLGDRDDLCVVGDDYQSIYGFTGASPEWLLGLPRSAFRRRPSSGWRRTTARPREVLALANRLVPQLGGAEKTLRATRPEGPEPQLRGFDSPEEEGAFVLERVRALAAEGVPYEEMAVLMRLELALGRLRGALRGREDPVPGRGPALPRRGRQLLKGLRGAGFGSLAEEVRRVAVEQGLADPVPEGVGERELVRQADLARLCKLAEEYDDGSHTVADWVEWLRARFDHGAEGGVHLLTLHERRGSSSRRSSCRGSRRRASVQAVPAYLGAVAEERRLLYVGMTRAKRHLALTWSGTRAASSPSSASRLRRRPKKQRADEPSDPTYQALKRWRLQRAKNDEIPAYVVFHNTTLAEIAERRPSTIAELGSVAGVGPAKLERAALRRSPGSLRRVR